MAVKTLDEMITAANEIIGENNSDEVISFLEDLTDTISAREPDGTDWKEKYEQNDAEWRKRYRERFSGKQQTIEPIQEPVIDEPDITIDDLFTDKE